MSDVLVLCYHAVSESWTAPLSITPQLLERQLQWLLDHGYRGTTFTQALTTPTSRKTVAVTFDDGFLSVYEWAYPIMARLGLPGTLFVPTSLIGGSGPMAWPGVDHWLEGPYESELVGMSWEQTAELADGGWEIGSHTRTHPHLTQLDGETLAQELEGSREDLERRLGRPCPSLAYPYGDVDERVVQAAAQAGYRTAAGLPGRYEPEDPLRWPRAGIYCYDEMPKFRRKVSVPVRRLRATRLWPLLSSARRKLRGL